MQITSRSGRKRYLPSEAEDRKIHQGIADDPDAVELGDACFANAKPAHEVPGQPLMEALAAKRGRGRPSGSTSEETRAKVNPRRTRISWIDSEPRAGAGRRASIRPFGPTAMPGESKTSLQREALVPDAVVKLAFDAGMTPAKAWRTHLELTQADVALRMGIGQSIYARLESSEKLRTSSREKIAAALGLGVGQLDF